MLLSCRRCGGGIVADAAAMREGFVTCDACDTAQWVGAGRAATALPEDVTAREVGGRLEIVAPRVPGSPSINRREIVPAAGVGAAAGALVFSVLGVVGAVPAGLLVFAVTAFGLAAARTHLPPLTVADGVVKPSSGLTAPVAAAELQQIYVAHRRMAIPDAPPMDVVNLYAIGPGEARVHLLGPLPSVAHALAIEDWLEVRLGLADRGVAGEADAAPRQRGPDPAAPAQAEAPAPPSACEACGAPLTWSAVALRAGWQRCGACDGLLLAAPPGHHGPLLGLGAPTTAPELVVVREGGGLRIDEASSLRGLTVRLRRLVLLPVWLTGVAVAVVIGMFVAFKLPGALTLPAVGATLLMGLLGAVAAVLGALGHPVVRVDARGASARWWPVPLPGLGWRVPAAQVADVRVRAAAGQADTLTAMTGAFQRLSDAMGRSGELDMAAEIAALGRIERVDVVVRDRAGRERALAAGLLSPDEAFRLASTARATLAGGQPGLAAPTS